MVTVLPLSGSTVLPRTSGGVQPSGAWFPGKCFYFQGLRNATSCILDTFYDNLIATDFIFYVMDENIKRLRHPPVLGFEGITKLVLKTEGYAPPPQPFTHGYTSGALPLKSFPPPPAIPPKSSLVLEVRSDPLSVGCQMQPSPRFTQRNNILCLPSVAAFIASFNTSAIFHILSSGLNVFANIKQI